MDSKTQEEAELYRYLLGEGSELERARLEEVYFADDEAFEQVLIAEEELIDAYAHGELSAAESARFEERFLNSPKGRERVKFALELSDAISRARPAEEEPEAVRPPRPSLFDALRARSLALRFALAAAAVVAIVGVSWLLVERARMRDQLRQLGDERAALRESVQESERRAATAQTRNEELLAQLESERARPTQGGQPTTETASQEQRPPGDIDRTPRRARENNAVIARRSQGRPRAPAPDEMTNSSDATIGSNSRRISDLPLSPTARAGSVSFDLKPGLVRGGGGNTLAVPEKATFILLQPRLDADSSHEDYRAVIETVEGRQVWRADSVKPRRPAGAGGTIKLPAVPARDLPPGDYLLLLSGKKQDGSLEDVADYSFRVVRK